MIWFNFPEVKDVIPGFALWFNSFVWADLWMAVASVIAGIYLLKCKRMNY